MQLTINFCNCHPFLTDACTFTASVAEVEQLGAFYLTALVEVPLSIFGE